MTTVAAPTPAAAPVPVDRIATAPAAADADASALLSFLLPEVEEQRVSDLLVEEINNDPGKQMGIEIPDHPPLLSSSFLREHNDVEDMDPLQVIEKPLNLSPLHETETSYPSPHSSDPQEQEPEQDLDENDLDDIIHSLERDNILLTPPVTPASATSLGVDFLPFVPMTTNEPGLSPYRKMSAPNPLSHYHSNCSIFITPTFRANGGRKAFGHKRKRSDFKQHTERSSSDSVLVLPPPRRRKSDDQGTVHQNTEKEIDALFEEPRREEEEKESSIVDIYDGLSDCSDETDETLSLTGNVESEAAETMTV